MGGCCRAAWAMVRSRLRAKPLVCLDPVGFPAGKLADEVPHALVAGAVDDARRIGSVEGYDGAHHLIFDSTPIAISSPRRHGQD